MRASISRAPVVAALLCAAIALAQPPPPRDPVKRHPVPGLRIEAPSYVAPPGAYIAGPDAPSQLYFFPLPYPVYAYPPQALPAPPDAPAKPAPETAQPPVGHILLVVEPVSAEVTLDGVRLTQRPDLSYAIGVLEGRHDVRVTASGFEPHLRTLHVRRGIGMFMTVRLLPVGAENKPP